MRRWLVAAALLLTALPAWTAEGHFWQLGHGTYAPYLTNSLQVVPEVDLARWDWLVVEIDGPDTIKAMNRLLEINPKLKFLARIWPINGLEPPDLGHSGTGSCLDYMLYPDRKAAIDRQTRETVRLLRNTISNYDSVVCFTFLEEIPGWFGLGELARYDGTGPLPKSLEHHKAAIEKARGKPLVWDAETKTWLGQQFIAAMASVHRLIKEESGGKLVLYWHHTNFATLDDLPEPRPADFDLVKWGGYPVYFRDLIRPGLCDGIMAYPNNGQIFEQKYLRHVRANNWLFFSQLSHPSFMRLCSWPDAQQMVLTKLPQNLGYFLYCEGTCAARGVWNDDQTLPRSPEWEGHGLSQALHLRHVARQYNVGFDVIKRYNHLAVSLDAGMADLKPGSVFHLVALVRNPKDETYYNEPAEAIARDVRVKLALPPGLINDQSMSASSDLKLGDLPAGGRKLVDWWLTVKDPKPLQAGKGLTVTATSTNSDPGSACTAVDVAFPGLGAHAIGASGATWTENGFRHGGLRPAIEIVATGEPVKNPTLTDGTDTVTYNGEVWAGMRLVITPDLKAKLYPENVLPDVTDQLRDAADPSGYRAWTEGYGVFSFGVGRYLRPGTKYRLTVCGRAADGAQSLVVLRHVKPDRSVWQPSFLANRFSDKWGEASEVIEVPVDVTGLDRVYFYRFHTTGSVWYGGASLMPADLPAEGVDVTDKLTGRPLRIGDGMLTDITYSDASPDAAGAKVKVRLFDPAEAKPTSVGKPGF